MATLWHHLPGRYPGEIEESKTSHIVSAGRALCGVDRPKKAWLISLRRPKKCKNCVRAKDQ